MHACLTGFWNLMCMAFLNKYNVLIVILQETSFTYIEGDYMVM